MMEARVEPGPTCRGPTCPCSPPENFCRHVVKIGEKKSPMSGFPGLTGHCVLNDVMEYPDHLEKTFYFLFREKFSVLNDGNVSCF